MMDYMEDSKWEVLNYLKKQAMDVTQLDESTINEMAYRYYKNYYSYEMDHDYALMNAVGTDKGVHSDRILLDTISPVKELEVFNSQDKKQ